MAKTYNPKKTLNQEEFRLPNEREYSMPDASHAKNAKALAPRKSTTRLTASLK